MLRHVQFEVTNACNHKCLYCYNGDRQEKTINKSYSEDHYLTLTKKLLDIGTASIVFTGGEPLLVIDKLWPSIDAVIKNGKVAQINTNATLLTPEIAKKLAERNVSLSVSFISSDPDIFDKTTGIKGSFDRVVRGIHTAIDAGVHIVRLNMVVTKLNLYQIYDTAEFIKKEFSINSENAEQQCKLELNPVSKPHDISLDSEIELSIEDMNLMFLSALKVRDRLGIAIDTGEPTCLCLFNDLEVAKMFHKLPCVPGSEHLTVEVNGNIRPCPMSSFVYGNILTADNVNEVLQQIISDYTKRDAKCIECPAFTQCYGGCPIQSEVRTGKKYGMCYEARPDKVPELIEKGIIQVH